MCDLLLDDFVLTDPNWAMDQPRPYPHIHPRGRVCDQRMLVTQMSLVVLVQAPRKSFLLLSRSRGVVDKTKLTTADVYAVPFGYNPVASNTYFIAIEADKSFRGIFR